MEPKNTVTTEFFKGFTNTNCEFFPCHKIKREREFNCLFCYCPLINYNCPGHYTVFTDKNGIVRKDCSQCNLPHEGYRQSWNFIQKWMTNPVTWDGK